MVHLLTRAMRITSMNTDRITEENILTIAIIVEVIEIVTITTMTGHTIVATAITETITTTIITTTITTTGTKKVLKYIKTGVHKNVPNTLTSNQLVITIHKIITNNKSTAITTKIKTTMGIISELIWI